MRSITLPRTTRCAHQSRSGTSRAGPRGRQQIRSDAIIHRIDYQIVDRTRQDARCQSSLHPDAPSKIRDIMARLRQIAQLGHPVLRTVAASVALPASDATRALIDDMMETLHDANGVGIAAPQVYEPAALFIVASRPNPRYPDAPLMKPEVVINPEILERPDELIKGWEGCLSIPGIRGNVPRHRQIRVRYQTVAGLTVEVEFRDFVARVFQHEDDHLHGIVFLDRLESTRDVITEKEYQKRLER
jgi:peptide deformylase